MVNVTISPRYVTPTPTSAASFLACVLIAYARRPPPTIKKDRKKPTALIAAAALIALRINEALSILSRFMSFSGASGADRFGNKV
jgi:hypothetical protein